MIIILVRRLARQNHTHLGAAEVAQLELVVLCVDQQVLRLDVSVADGVLVYVAQGSAHLVRVQLDKHGRHALVVLGVRLADAVDLHHTASRQY